MVLKSRHQGSLFDQKLRTHKIFGWEAFDSDVYDENAFKFDISDKRNMDQNFRIFR